MFLRFLRFNVVGAMGVAVQIASLALLVSGLGLHYLPATAIAIELSLLHNFLWHERWTWGDRARDAQGTMQNAGGTEPNAECRMQNAGGPAQNAGGRVQNAECATRTTAWRRDLRPRLARLVAFHAGNGLVSMAGSLVLMPVFVGLFGLHYIVANLATIAATGLFNFVLGDRLIFRALSPHHDSEQREERAHPLSSRAPPAGKPPSAGAAGSAPRLRPGRPEPSRRADLEARLALKRFTGGRHPNPAAGSGAPPESTARSVSRTGRAAGSARLVR